MSDPMNDATEDGIEPADLSAFLISEDIEERHHSDVVLGGETVRFYFRSVSRSEALTLAKLADEDTVKSLAEFDRQILATLTIEPTQLTHSDVKRWQARKGSQAALGQLVGDVMEKSGFVVNAKEETERFPR